MTLLYGGVAVGLLPDWRRHTQNTSDAAHKPVAVRPSGRETRTYRLRRLWQMSTRLSDLYWYLGPLNLPCIRRPPNTLTFLLGYPALGGLGCLGRTTEHAPGLRGNGFDMA